MTTRTFLAIAIVAACVAPGDARDPENCLLCHQYRGLSRFDPQADRLHLFYVSPEYHSFSLGPHARLACTDCHLRAEVSVIPHEPVSPVDCTRTCHLTDPRGLERRFSHEQIPSKLAGSAHDPARLAALEFTGGPLLDPGQSACLYCHDEPLFRDPAGVIPALEALGARTFDRCDACHAELAPVDTAYYLRHIASRLQAAKPTLEMAQGCAICHSDPLVVEQTGTHDAVASYMRSFHGKAALLGDTTTANCLDCHVRPGHTAHQMLGPDHPASAVHAERVADSCRAIGCHPGADPSLAAAAVHLTLPQTAGAVEFLVALAFVVLTVLTFGPSMLIVVLELFGMVVGRHGHDGRHQRLVHAILAHPRGRALLTRFTVHQRIQHWVLVVLFSLLALTGFPMKFAEAQWSRWVIDAFGGLHIARVIHHWAGIALVVGMVYHFIYFLTTLKRRLPDGRKRSWLAALNDAPMWLSPVDLRKAGQLLGYLLFLRPQPPTFDRFGVKEKFEYIGVFWGTVLLGVTGALLWGEQLMTHLFGGRLLNIALIAHTYEAFLAIIHVGILHIINVMLSPHVFPLSPATITGQTPPAEMAAGHSEQVERVARELGVRTPDGQEGGHA